MKGGLLATFLGVALGVSALSGCAADRTRVDAQTVKDAGAAGTWRGSQGQEVKIEGAGDEYRIDASGAGGARTYPMRILRIDASDIAEVEIDRKEEGKAVGIGYVYGRISVTGNSLEYRALKQSWLEGRAPSEGLRVSPLAGGRAALAVGNAQEMKSMLEAAVADENAWEGPELWSRVK